MFGWRVPRYAVNPEKKFGKNMAKENPAGCFARHATSSHDCRSQSTQAEMSAVTAAIMIMPEMVDPGSSLDPCCHRIQQVAANIVFSPATCGNVERMVGVWEEFQVGKAAEPIANVLKQAQLCQFVTRALKKEHWNSDIKKMIRPLN